MADIRLLIVEDDVPSLELMAEVFSTLKANVCAINDSQKAANLITQERFDGIFVDLEMPNLGGLELARKIRHSNWNRSTPIIIVTGRDDRNTMQQAFATGATFFLQKPVDRQKLTTLYRTVRGSFLETRRRTTRVSLQTDVICSTGTQTFRGRSWNLSSGGMLIEGGDLHQGEMLRVSFRLPGSSVVIDAFGVVAWVSGERLGIQFTKMSYKNEQEIKDFITQVEKLD